MKDTFPNIELPFPYRPKKRDIVDKGVVEAVKRTIKDDDKFIYKYSCAMLNLSDDVSSIVKYWTKKNIPTEHLYISDDKGINGYSEESHVTICYGITDTNPKNLIKIANGYGPIELKFCKVDKFDTNPDFDVIKITMDSDKLRYLNNSITKNMTCVSDFSTYEPHTTLAYVKKGSCDNLVGDTFFESLFDTVDEIYFASRDGQEHFIDL